MGQHKDGLDPALVEQLNEMVDSLPALPDAQLEALLDVLYLVRLRGMGS